MKAKRAKKAMKRRASGNPTRRLDKKGIGSLISTRQRKQNSV